MAASRSSFASQHSTKVWFLDSEKTLLHFVLIPPNQGTIMGVNEDDLNNIMGGMEAGGIKVNDQKRKLKNRLVYLYQSEFPKKLLMEESQCL